MAFYNTKKSFMHEKYRSAAPPPSNTGCVVLLCVVLCFDTTPKFQALSAEMASCTQMICGPKQ